MADFIENPTVGQTVEFGDVTYKWNGDGWQVDVGEGGGSSEWTDNSGVLHPNTHATDTVAIGTDTGDSNAELTIDGSGSFKSQSSSPTATAGHAKIYAKEVTGLPNVALLYHFDNNANDSSGNNPGIDGTAEDVIYSTTDAKSGFGYAAGFDGDDNTIGGDSYITFADVGIGTGDFTIEFFFTMSQPPQGENSAGALLTVDTGTSGSDTTGYFAIYLSGTTMYIALKNASGWVTESVSWGNFSYGDDEWMHFGIVREGDLYTVYRDGVEKDHWDDWGDDVQIGDSSYDWVIGRLRNGGSQGLADWNFSGRMDNLLITKDARHSDGALSVPTAPYVGGTTTQIFVCDSSGNETQIS